MKTFFITGTDTDCGKTYVTCRMLDYFNERSIKAKALKPVASGCIVDNGTLLSTDVQALAAHQPLESAAICRWLFEPPVSPHIAAKEAGQQLGAQEIANFCRQETFQHNDILLIEGAGGLMVPLNDTETWIDFLKIMHIPAIFVVAIRLGCINHALLTDIALQANQVQCTGWIANFLQPDSLRQEENLHTLQRKINAPLLGCVRYNGLFEPITSAFPFHCLG